MYKLLIKPIDFSTLGYYSKTFNIHASWDKGAELTLTVVSKGKVIEEKVIYLYYLMNEPRLTMDGKRRRIADIADQLRDKYILDYQNLLAA